MGFDFGKNLAIAAGVVAGFAVAQAPAQSMVLGGYTFEGEVLTPSGVATGVSLSDFSYSGNGSTSFPDGDGSTDSFSANGWNTAGDFFEFLVTSGANTLTQLDLVARASGTGPEDIGIFSSADSFAAAIGTLNLPNTSYQSLSINLVPFNLNSATTFRIFGSGASGSSGTLRIDDVVVSGEASTTPIPTPAMLPGLIGFGMSVLRRRKGQADA